MQLITGLRIAENGSYCENVKKGRKSQGEGGCTKNGSYCEKEKNQWGGQGRCERRSRGFVKIQKKNIFFGGAGMGGGGGVGGVRVDVKLL